MKPDRIPPEDRNLKGTGMATMRDRAIMAKLGAKVEELQAAGKWNEAAFEKMVALTGKVMGEDADIEWLLVQHPDNMPSADGEPEGEPEEA